MFDEGQVPAHLGELRLHRVAMLLDQGQARGLVAVPGPHQLGVAPDAADGHAGLAQALQDLDPRQVVIAVAAMTRPGALDAVDQPGSLLVAQRVRAHARDAGSVGDGEPCLDGHSIEGRT